MRIVYNHEPPPARTTAVSWGYVIFQGGDNGRFVVLETHLKNTKYPGVVVVATAVMTIVVTTTVAAMITVVVVIDRH